MLFWLRELFVEFLWFGLRQARACVFAGSFFAVLVLSRHVPTLGLARYDFLCVAAIAIQVILVATRIETLREVAVLSIFHALGLAMEIFKTQPEIGSWAYPEAGVLKIMGVPLYSGFMYAAVASYMCQAWRLLDLRLRRHPPLWVTVPLSAAIYGNFYWHHSFVDLRWWLAALVVIVYVRTSVAFTAHRRQRRMPLLASFALIGFFVFVAENIGSYFGAFVYPHQADGWELVKLEKWGSWTLLVIVSFMIVANLKQADPWRRRAEPLPSMNPQAPTHSPSRR